MCAFFGSPAHPACLLITALHIEDLALARGDRVLFEGFSLSLQRGEAAVLVGANGAGKTSLLRTVAGFIRPLAGKVRFAGEAGDLEAADARAQDLHLLGHHDGLKPGRSAWEELVFQVRWTGGSLADAERVRDLLKLAPLCALEVRKLSAGQRRRLALARLIASPRSLWLLDEPLGPLDAERREAFGRHMQDHLGRGGMILAAVHDPLPIPVRSVEVGG
ncbi:heme ABC exporter ATP-binding protein CcmA [soil metagenome]